MKREMFLTFMHYTTKREKPEKNKLKVQGRTCKPPHENKGEKTVKETSLQEKSCHRSYLVNHKYHKHRSHFVHPSIMIEVLSGLYLVLW